MRCLKANAAGRRLIRAEIPPLAPSALPSLAFEFRPAIRRLVSMSHARSTIINILTGAAESLHFRVGSAGYTNIRSTRMDIVLSDKEAETPEWTGWIGGRRSKAGNDEFWCSLFVPKASLDDVYQCASFGKLTTLHVQLGFHDLSESAGEDGGAMLYFTPAAEILPNIDQVVSCEVAHISWKI